MTEPLVLVNVFALPLQAVDGAAASRIACLAHAPGFHGTRQERLHGAVFLDAAQQLVNSAPWETATAHWRGRKQERGYAPHDESAPYRVASVTPDPATLAAGSQFVGQSAQPAERNV